MKMSLRFTAGVLMALITGAASFAQHYTQTNLRGLKNQGGHSLPIVRLD